MAFNYYRTLSYCIWIVWFVSELGHSFDLTILHTNDVHARFDQYTIRDGQCRQNMSAEGKCYGGLARRAGKIAAVRREFNNVLLLDAGDQYQGTPWFYVYKGKAASHFMNQLRYDAMVREIYKI